MLEPMVILYYCRHRKTYSSSSSSPPAGLLAAAARLRLTRPGRPPPNGEVTAKSMCCRAGMVHQW